MVSSENLVGSFSLMANDSTIHVAFILYEGVNFLDVSGPLEAFSIATKSSGKAAHRYRTSMISVAGGLVRTSSGMEVNTMPCTELGRVDTLIVPGGGNPAAPTVPDETVRWIATTAEAVRRLCSVCTGAFLLAAAGQLDGHKVTTHWAAANLLRRKAPEAQVEDDHIYISAGKLWTCAGVTAGIDLALALIENDYGFEVSMLVARYLVVYLRRQGSQTQYSKPFALQAAADASFAALHAWIRDNLAEPLTIDRLARVAGMSPRTFSRLYRKRMGLTPAHVIAHLRLEAAQGAIERGTASLKSIARDYGFGNARNLRRTLERQVVTQEAPHLREQDHATLDRVRAARFR